MTTARVDPVMSYVLRLVDIAEEVAAANYRAASDDPTREESFNRYYSIRCETAYFFLHLTDRFLTDKLDRHQRVALMRQLETASFSYLTYPLNIREGDPEFPNVIRVHQQCQAERHQVYARFGVKKPLDMRNGDLYWEFAQIVANLVHRDRDPVIATSLAALAPSYLARLDVPALLREVGLSA